jgi:hypothetical protein
VGILLPRSNDFRCFPAGTGPYFSTWDVDMHQFQSWLVNWVPSHDWVIDEICFLNLYPHVSRSQQQIWIPRPQKPLIDLYKTPLSPKKQIFMMKKWNFCDEIIKFTSSDV